MRGAVGSGLDKSAAWKAMTRQLNEKVAKAPGGLFSGKKGVAATAAQHFSKHAYNKMPHAERATHDWECTVCSQSLLAQELFGSAVVRDYAAGVAPCRRACHPHTGTCRTGWHRDLTVVFGRFGLSVGCWWALAREIPCQFCGAMSAVRVLITCPLPARRWRRLSQGQEAPWRRWGASQGRICSGQRGEGPDRDPERPPGANKDLYARLLARGARGRPFLPKHAPTCPAQTSKQSAFCTPRS